MLTGINHITLAVTNLSLSFEFYKNILKFKPLCKWDKGAYFLAGNDWLCLSLDNSLIKKIDSGYTHIAFNIEQDKFTIMKEHLYNCEVSLFKENNSEGDSLYLLDPDGHKLEIHVGNWQSRINAKKLNFGSWQGVEFYI